MTLQADIREGVARIGVGGINPLENARPNEYGYQIADDILAYLHSQGVVIKRDWALGLPLNPFDTVSLKGMYQTEGYIWTRDTMLKAGYVVVDSLIK